MNTPGSGPKTTGPPPKRRNIPGAWWRCAASIRWPTTRYPEIERCALDQRFARGIKLQFAVADVSLDNPAMWRPVAQIFRAADAHRMAIVVHMRTRRARPYGAAEAQVFLEQLLAAAPDVPVQIAHFTGGGNPNDTAADDALAVFIEAIKRHDPRVKHLYFDTALIVAADDTPERKAWVAQRIRDIGLSHVLYGSDRRRSHRSTTEDAGTDLPFTAAHGRRVQGNREQRRAVPALPP